MDGLAPGAIQLRAASAALHDDRGAEFMALASAPSSAQQTLQQLLQWSCELRDLPAARGLIGELPEGSRAWAFGHGLLATSFRDKLSADEQLELLNTAWKRARAKVNADWSIELQALVVSALSDAQPELLAAELDGISASRLVRPLAKLGKLKDAERLAARSSDPDAAYLGIAAQLTAAGKHAEARNVAEKATGPLAKARAEHVLGVELAERGDMATAEQAFAAALAAARNVRVTNARPGHSLCCWTTSTGSIHRRLRFSCSFRALRTRIRCFWWRPM